MADPEKSIERQILCPGVILEKCRETIGKINYYTMKIEVQIFKEVDFSVDFSGSTKIKIEGIDDWVCRVTALPFTKVTVAKLVLSKGWNLKTKFKCYMDLPPINYQTDKLAPMIEAINQELENTKELEFIDVSELTENVVVEYLTRCGSSFVDHDFKPKSASISEELSFCINHYNCIAHWRKAKYLILAPEECKKVASLYTMFSKNIKPSDVVSGRVDNSWLLVPIYALADYPKLIKRIILTKEPNEQGIYKIKLFNLSKWITLYLDDYFPCQPFGDPLFAQATSGEIWPLLLEKAFAKRYGQYSKLVSGSSKSAFIDLTSCPTFTYNLNDSETKEMLAEKNFYRRLYKYKKAGYIMVATSNSTKPEIDIGLDLDHAYAILGVHVKEKIFVFNYTMTGNKFNGTYKEGSEAWTADLKFDVNPVFNDSYIYVSFNEFEEHFKSITVCKIKKYNELYCKGKFIETVDIADEKLHDFTSRWYYRITIDKPTRLTIGIHQTDESICGVRETSPYIDIGFGVLSVVEDSYQYITFENPSYERDVYREMQLEPGSYLIVPKSSGITLQETLGISTAEENFDAETMKAVVRDHFEKLDLQDKGYLTYDEIAVFFSYFIKDFEQNDVKQTIEDYLPPSFKNVDTSKITLKIFTEIFKSIYKDFLNDEKFVFFEKIGYTKDLQSIRCRLFGLSIHSQWPIELATEDGLKTAIDETLVKLLLKNEGIDISRGAKIKLSNKQVIACQYYNR